MSGQQDADGRDRHGEMQSVRQEVERDRGPVGGAIQGVGHLIASPWFLIALAASHLGWMLLNSGWIPGLEPWDPYPFTFLATLASVETPILSVMILMRQNRESHINELREELHLQIGLKADRKVTAALRLLDNERRRGGEGRGVSAEELDELERPLHPRALFRAVRQQVEEAEGEESGQSGSQ